MILESLHLIKAYSARAMNYLESYSISKDDLLSVAANFPGMLLRTNPNPNPNLNPNPNPNPNPNQGALQGWQAAVCLPHALDVVRAASCVYSAPVCPATT